MKQRQRGNTVIGLIIGIVFGLGVALGIAVYVTKVPIPFMTKTQRGGAEQDEAEARKNRDWDPNGPLSGKAGQPRTPAPATAQPQAQQQTPQQQPSQPSSQLPQAPAPQAVTVVPNQQLTGAPIPSIVPRTSRPVEAGNSGRPSADPLGDLARARTSDNAGTVASAGAAGAAGAEPFMYFVQAGAFRTTEDAEAQRAKLTLMGVEARVTEREQAGRTVYRVRAGPFNKKDDADRLKDRLDSGGLEAALVRVQR
ncbi:MAG: SPOR domain-containing protein [Pseudomonadota bacterium]